MCCSICLAAQDHHRSQDPWASPLVEVRAGIAMSSSSGRITRATPVNAAHMNTKDSGRKDGIASRARRRIRARLVRPPAARVVLRVPVQAAPAKSLAPSPVLVGKRPVLVGKRRRDKLHRGAAEVLVEAVGATAAAAVAGQVGGGADGLAGGEAALHEDKRRRVLAVMVSPDRIVRPRQYVTYRK